MDKTNDIKERLPDADCSADVPDHGAITISQGLRKSREDQADTSLITLTEIQLSWAAYFQQNASGQTREE
jgi:hypothetical protein